VRARTRASVVSAGSLWDASASSLGFDTCSPRAGIASAIRTAADSAADSSGRRSTRSTTAGQNLKPPPATPPRRASSGMRPRSILGPSNSRTAGSAVTEPATAQATTAIVPLATPLSTSEPTTYIPAIAIATVLPEISTVRPDVRAVRSRASCEDWPRPRSSRERTT